LVEYQAPSGFQIPMGQWRLTNNANNATIVGVEYIGGLTIPSFVYNDFSPIEIDRFLGNMLQLELPMTGGSGMSVSMAVAGGSVVGMAGLMISIIYVRKKLAAKGSRSRYGKAL